MRATAKQRELVEKKLETSSAGVTAYLRDVEVFYDYLRKHPDRAHDTFALLLRDVIAGEPDVSEISEEDAGQLAQQAQQQPNPEQQKVELEAAKVQQTAQQSEKDNEIRVSEVMLAHQRELMKMGVERDLEEQRRDAGHVR